MIFSTFILDEKYKKQLKMSQKCSDLVIRLDFFENQLKNVTWLRETSVILNSLCKFSLNQLKKIKATWIFFSFPYEDMYENSSYLQITSCHTITSK